MARTPKTAEEVQTFAVDKQLDLTPHPGWRSRVRDYTPLIGEENQSALDELRDVAYALALRGADEKDIAELFGFELSTVRAQLGPVIKIAKAELRIKLKADQIEFALTSKQPIAKIFAGKQHADQTDEPSATLGEEGDGSINLNIRVVRKGDVDPADAA